MKEKEEKKATSGKGSSPSDDGAKASAGRLTDGDGTQ
jgi:hypothetical protein